MLLVYHILKKCYNREVEENMQENKDEIGDSVKQNNNQLQIAGAIVLTGLIVAGAILLKGGTPPPAAPQADNTGTTPVALEARPISKEDHITGNTNAKIVILEYSDLECPYCKVFHATMHRVIENNKNVAWVYRHYPIPQLHSKAPHEAEATECAWEQGGNDAFWKYTDRVFEVTTSNDRLDSSELPKIAEYVGLNVASFNTCLASGKYKAKVQADVDDGVTMGVNGTPSSFILVNGKVVGTIPGAQPYETVIQKLNAIK